MKRPHPLAATVFTAALVLAGGTACSNDDSPNTTAAADAPGAEASGPAAGIEAATVALDEGRTVIDVRTVEEYDAGHIGIAERFQLFLWPRKFVQIHVAADDTPLLVFCV